MTWASRRRYNDFPLYAGLLGLISMGVAFPAGSLRGKLNVSVGAHRLA